MGRLKENNFHDAGIRNFNCQSHVGILHLARVVHAPYSILLSTRTRLSMERVTSELLKFKLICD